MPSKEFLSKYQNPEEYDKTFTGPAGDELGFYSGYVGRFEKVLYLGSGSGRLLKKFLELNSDITAVEFSKEMVEFSREKLPRARILHKDALELELGDKFDLAIAPYRFLTHFDPAELERLFGVISRHLLPGGCFVGDIFSPYLPHDRSIKCEIESIEVAAGMIEKTYNCYDHNNQICVEVIEKTDIKNGQVSAIEMPWHYYYPEQLAALAEKNGLKVENFYGSFDKKPLDNNCYDLIFVMRKS